MGGKRLEGKKVQLSGAYSSIGRSAAIESFARGRDAARRMGASVVYDPSLFCNCSMTRERAMRKCLECMLGNAEAVLMLPGWESSDGACTEHAVAKAVGLDIVYGEEEMPGFEWGGRNG